MSEPENDFLSFFYDLWDKHKVLLIPLFVGVVLIIVGIYMGIKDFVAVKKPQYSLEKIASSSAEIATQKIKVDVEGAVVNPGVINLEKGSRVEDALKKTGGLNKKADKEQIAKTINLAAKVVDGQKIYFPFLTDKQKSSVSNTSLSTTSDQVSVNEATRTQLESLPGVGPSTALKIINGRPYEQLEDLVVKKVVGKSLFEKIKNSLTL